VDIYTGERNHAGHNFPLWCILLVLKILTYYLSSRSSETTVTFQVCGQAPDTNSIVVDLELASPRKRRQMMKLLKLDPEARQKYSSERLATQPDVCYRRRPASFPVSFKVEKAECGPNSPASEAEHEVRTYLRSPCTLRACLPAR
jgi:hypothetical protein